MGQRYRERLLGNETSASTGSLTGLDAAFFASASTGSARTRTGTGSRSGTGSSTAAGSTSATGGFASATESTKYTTGAAGFTAPGSAAGYKYRSRDDHI